MSRPNYSSEETRDLDKSLTDLDPRTDAIAPQSNATAVIVQDRDHERVQTAAEHDQIADERSVDDLPENTQVNAAGSHMNEQLCPPSAARTSFGGTRHCPCSPCPREDASVCLGKCFGGITRVQPGADEQRSPIDEPESRLTTDERLFASMTVSVEPLAPLVDGILSDSPSPHGRKKSMFFPDGKANFPMQEKPADEHVKLTRMVATALLEDGKEPGAVHSLQGGGHG
ncbi:hypothetical protein EK21DRAFT_91633 [Setomelanomma holmii]|uniref:Uncharacterized protein n=1 Tax=Setomelanomma holmii TaxID=210430 RepID=A0A9P4H465_9PLEO|nr:hypothetical protein EK21DRAFT_91633 [Setomelanomma holmii]